jgi:hypothetical protein
MQWIACSLALLAANAAEPAVAISGSAQQAVSTNFIVHSRHPGHDARQVAEHCERWRTKLQRYWRDAESDAWSPKCEVVVHAGSRGYLAAVGAGASQTFGSSLIQFGKDQQVARRLIDFRGDSLHGLAAVPHEMTHVILADCLGGRQPPRWADEGMAILADSHEKQLLHERDLSQGLAARGAFRIHELLTLDAYPHPSRIPAFYGQSASLTACLAKRDDPAKFVEFLRRSLDQGYDQALRDIYHLDNIAQLERLWQDQRLAWQSGYHGVRLAIADAAANATRGAECNSPLASRLPAAVVIDGSARNWARHVRRHLLDDWPHLG